MGVIDEGLGQIDLPRSRASGLIRHWCRCKPEGLSPLTPCGQRATCTTVAATIPSWARCPQGLETARPRQAIWMARFPQRW